MDKTDFSEVQEMQEAFKGQMVKFFDESTQSVNHFVNDDGLTEKISTYMQHYYYPIWLFFKKRAYKVSNRSIRKVVIFDSTYKNRINCILKIAFTLDTRLDKFLSRSLFTYALTQNSAWSTHFQMKNKQSSKMKFRGHIYFLFRKIKPDSKKRSDHLKVFKNGPFKKQGNKANHLSITNVPINSQHDFTLVDQKKKVKHYAIILHSNIAKCDHVHTEDIKGTKSYKITSEKLVNLKEKCTSIFITPEFIMKIKAIKPRQIHHYATNKHQKYTPKFKNIITRYGLDLDEAWNKELLPHQGRHAQEYHEMVLGKITLYDTIAKGNRTLFLTMYEELKNEIRNNPQIMYKQYWKVRK